MENYTRVNFNNNTILNIDNTYLIHFIRDNMLINAKLIFQSDQDITFRSYHKTNITDYIDPNEVIWQPYPFDIIINNHLFINNRVILYTINNNNNALVNPPLHIHNNNHNIFTPIPRSRSPSPISISPINFNRIQGGKYKKRKTSKKTTKKSSKRKRRKSLKRSK